MKQHTRITAAAALVAGISLFASACATPSTDTGNSSEPPAGDASARVAVAYENGIAVLDGTTLEVIQEFATEEFTRVNPFGDGRHIAVSTSKGFQLLDTETPELTDLVFDASAPGHVVTHHGKTVLFDDGTGTTTIMESDALLDDNSALPESTTYTAPVAHHGVSIVLEDGTLLTTLGDDTGRTGATALRAEGTQWNELASNAECPGIHGEGTAANEAVIFGCEDGALLFRDGQFTKFAAPDAYGRMGNAFVAESSPIVVGDYKSDPDAEGYLLNAITLINTETDSYEVVTLPENVRYTFRDLARGPADLAYILSTDGSIHVLDPNTGEITDSFPVVDAWEGPADWQDAHPAIKVNGNIAYVTEPATNSIHAVDLTTGETVATTSFEFTPNEIAVALG